MLRYLCLCLTAAAILMSALLPASAARRTVCPSTVVVTDVCYAPGVGMTVQAPAEKPCFTCTITEARDPASPRDAGSKLALSQKELDLSDRSVPPDFRPPRA
ncbi:hypothetical protein [Celeribacter sp. PS-C1]|uniref:hypothetical protein n=1 Tax=Celeribacter sp. PS-C1 TaxID=2820813 RepID=UPI001CA4BEDB|nr:hypothetical protein [Celeribacter sp. PS-C1]MBW6417616.1 hypothetical protein [Celeribacter sp. PS-C1]